MAKRAVLGQMLRCGTVVTPVGYGRVQTHACCRQQSKLHHGGRGETPSAPATEGASAATSSTIAVNAATICCLGRRKCMISLWLVFRVRQLKTMTFVKEAHLSRAYGPKLPSFRLWLLCFKPNANRVYGKSY